MIKNIIIGNLPFIFLILILGVFLGVKAVPENGWDNWQYGSAQALLSGEHWVKDGFFKNYLMFLPQGYSKVVRYFDDLPLRQHAHGTVAGGFIGQRLYYNHYPAGYLVPTALLMKFGIEKRFWFRFLEILFSLGSLVFLYWFLNKICNRIGAFLGTFFYAISVLFLGHADSLANQPIDSLLSFAIVALSVWLAESISESKKYLTYGIWVLYFVLSLSSYDSTFFIFAWLVGLDLITEKKIQWGKTAFWAMAPILAFGLQTLQSLLYLGWRDMLLDFYGIYKLRIISADQSNFLLSHLERLINPFNEFFFPKLGILIAVVGFAYVWLIRSSKYRRAYKYLILSGIATLFNFLVFPSLFFYQGKLVAVFGGILVALIISESLEALRGFKISFKKPQFLHLIALICVAVIFIAQARTSYLYYNWKARNDYNPKAIAFAKKVGSLVSGDKVVFQLLNPIYEMPLSNPNPPYVRPTEETYADFSIHGNHNGVQGNDPYPQVNPIDEYYVGSPILGFARTSDLIRDLSYLKRRSEFPFSVIILSDQKDMLQKLRNDIIFNKISKANISIARIESDKFAAVIPDNDKNVKQDFSKNDLSLALDLEDNQNYYVISALKSPGVEGNVVASGIYGKVVLASGQPFEAALDIFKNGNMSKPFISVLSDPNGDFQIPLKPAYYIIRPANPYRSLVPELANYYIHIGAPQWIQIKIKYK